MLQVFVNKVDIVRISKLLVKYNIKATINETTITIYGTVPQDLASLLYSNTNIIAFRNYDAQGDIPIDKETFAEDSIEKATVAEDTIGKETAAEDGIEAKKANIIPETRPETTLEPNTDHEVVYNTSDVAEKPKCVRRYPKVKRGQVYLCDFGEHFEHEQGGKRYTIIIQNDAGNNYSPNTIVIPCTSQNKAELPVHHSFKFSPENMVDYSKEKVSDKTNVALGEAVTTVSKSRLIDYLGTMTESFMDEKIQPIIDCSLALKRKNQIVTVSKPEVKTVIQTKTVYVEKDLDAVQMDGATYRDLNLTQIQIKLVSFVDINELMSISKISAGDRDKACKILQLFGFDLSQNGVQYLLDAICISPKSEYFNLETLSKKLYETGEYTIDASEIQRLMVARVKERFRFKKSPTVDFIRLVNRLLTKKEEN